MNQEEFIRDICKVTPMSKSEARNSLNLIITQAIAEERKRVRGEIGGMKGLVANPDYFIRVQRELRNNQATEGLDDKFITQIVWVAKDRVLSDLLSSLDKPLTDN